MNRLSARKYYAQHHTGKHVPNKEEAKELRRIMQKSGMTEVQVRADKGNRRKLANARNKSGDGSNQKRLLIRAIRNSIAADLGTHVNDPKVQKLAEADYKTRFCRKYFTYR